MYEINKLNVKIDEKEILKDISFQVQKSKFISIIGGNGSGKSTLIKAISKFLGSE